MWYPPGSIAESGLFSRAAAGQLVLPMGSTERGGESGREKMWRWQKYLINKQETEPSWFPSPAAGRGGKELGDGESGRKQMLCIAGQSRFFNWPQFAPNHATSPRIVLSDIGAVPG